MSALRVVVGLLGLLPQESEPARLFKLFEGVYLIEAKAAAKPALGGVPETDGGAPTILAAVPGLVLLHVPPDASLVRLRTTEAVTRDLRLSEAEPPLPAESIDGLGLEPEGFAMVVDNRGASWILSIVLDARGALRSTAFVGAGARTRTALRQDEELRFFEPASRAWIARRLPPSLTERSTAEPEGWWLNTGPFRLRGITPAALFVAGRDLQTDIGKAAADFTFASDPGSFEFKDQIFQGIGAELELDVDLLRLSVGLADGTLTGHGDFTPFSGGFSPKGIDIEGDFRSLTVEAWWPALRAEGEILEFGVGPTIGYAWVDEHLKNRGSGFVRVDEEVTAQAGLVGLRLGFDILPRPVILRFGASVNRSFGDAEGWIFEALLGVFIEF